MNDVHRDTLANIGRELMVSVRALSKIVSAAFVAGNRDVAFTKDPADGRVLYPVEAVKAAVRGAQALAAVVGADEESRAAIVVATKRSAKADEHREQKARRKIEGSNAKRNRAAARAAR